MGARVERDVILAALRLRYDHYSAENVLAAALDRAGLVGATGFDVPQLGQLRAALERVGDRLGRVLAELDALGAAPVTGAPVAAVVAAPAPVVAAPAPVVAAPAPVVEAAPVVAPAPAVEPAAAVTIAVTGVEVADGAEVLVCGDAPALGAWDPTKAARMEPAGAAWTTTIAVDAEAELAFKFLRREPDGDVVWEAGDNRVARARSRIDATWRATVE